MIGPNINVNKNETKLVDIKPNENNITNIVSEMYTTFKIGSINIVLKSNKSFSFFRFSLTCLSLLTNIK